jgi:hypothetical protein
MIFVTLLWLKKGTHYICRCANLSCINFQIVAVLIYHSKRHHSSGLPPLSTTQAVRYLWSKLLMFAQLQHPRYVHEDDGGLPPVSAFQHHTCFFPGLRCCSHVRAICYNSKVFK